ncbi:nucleotidyltransferase domain-containing protein [Pseudonocardia phyllosphaerae]|uniref:nucleotidyltransferase domain-containing protein n=1 Tax=Pseudonocardia phyllosphaerae TaxID=3390502 RepID=UPI00397CE7CC
MTYRRAGSGSEPALAAVRAAVAGRPGLGLLLLHGSRSRGEEHTGSDWDFGYLADVSVDGDTDVSVDSDTEVSVDKATDVSVDPAALYDTIASALGTDAVDLADLRTSSALLRFEAARDGVVVVGAEEEHRRFVLEAVHFWCDAGPVIRRAQAEVLAGLDR